MVEAKPDPGREGFFRIEIKDTGIGIPIEKQSMLFQKFFQVDSKATRDFGGTGLGLAISKRLVALMDGEIGLVSAAGKGSTFWFALPIVLPEAGVAGPRECAQLRESATPDKTARGRRVLLAEDEATNQQLAIRLLKKLNCQVDVAANGAQAVAMAARTSYDAIFMDCLMPEVDGWEAARLIRLTQNGGRRVPIIAVTASVIAEQREKSFAAGMDDFVEKPIQDGALERILAKWTTQPPEHSEKLEREEYENAGH